MRASFVLCVCVLWARVSYSTRCHLPLSLSLSRIIWAIQCVELYMWEKFVKHITWAIGTRWCAITSFFSAALAECVCCRRVCGTQWQWQRDIIHTYDSTSQRDTRAIHSAAAFFGQPKNITTRSKCERQYIIIYVPCCAVMSITAPCHEPCLHITPHTYFSGIYSYVALRKIQYCLMPLPCTFAHRIWYDSIKQYSFWWDIRHCIGDMWVARGSRPTAQSVDGVESFATSVCFRLERTQSAKATFIMRRCWLCIQ